MRIDLQPQSSRISPLSQVLLLDRCFKNRVCRPVSVFAFRGFTAGPGLDRPEPVPLD